MVPSQQQPTPIPCPPLPAIPLLPEQPRGRPEKVKVGISSRPYLADHGFQGLVVLPGSFYIETALRVHLELFKKRPTILQTINFQKPVILSDEEILIKVEVEEKAGSPVKYVFSELANEIGESYTPVACLEVREVGLASKPAPEFSIEEFKIGAGSFIEAKEFYRVLRENGNEYGARFQNLSAIWRSGNVALGRLSVVGNDSETGQGYLHPTLLDSITQLLAALILEKGRAFALESIDRIEIEDTNFPEALWVRATQQPGTTDDPSGFVGNIEVFDESGNRYLELVGVAFSYLAAVDAALPPAELALCVAASFTAEPLEDSLKFWGHHFGLTTNVQFAPYNQIFQQLLDRGSAFHKNDNGVNVILLDLEDWVTKDEPAPLKAGGAKLTKCFANHSRYLLPNGLEIVHLNQYETDYLYQEIFRDECYLRHGIRINDGDTVVDIGANIGMFSLFVLNKCRNPRIYAFEPSPVVYELLKANCEAYGENVHAFQCGVAEKPKTADFTFYHKSSVFSGFHSDVVEDKEAIEAVVRNVLRSQISEESREAAVKDLTADRVHHQTYQCQLISLSEIIRQNQLEKIHLLKIDAEKSELDVIQGIDDDHWPLIDQIVIEIHDRTRMAVERVERLLIAKGYRCAIEQETLLEDSGLFSIYASRLEKLEAVDSAASMRPVGCSLVKNSGELCAALNSFMRESKVPLLLCVCPRVPESASNPGLSRGLDAAEQELLLKASKIANVHALGSQLIVDRYRLEDYCDTHSRQLGHVSYTPEGYAAIGTTLFETIFRLKSKPLKVLVLDCDNTLWQGVCGEDGALGIQITNAHRALQEFAVKQVNAGLLICLCSKNNERDVFDVIDQRPEMVLKREHLTSWQINWNRKSENIKTLAAKLDLGLDSFVFIDDNPVDCAEVSFNCPEVLTLQLPQKSENIAAFLNGIWPLVGAPSTREDQKRTQMYQENVRREQLREQTVSLKDFLDGLQLGVELTEPTEDQIGRVSQLTWRTNQFNFTTIRRSENEINSWLEKESRQCLVASVRDRFGDYGLVGVLLYETEADQFTIDTFLLSCRVLGRGVEHRLLSELGRGAEREGKKFVELRYLPTEKNSPAFEFLKSLGTDLVPEGTTTMSIKLPARTLAQLEYDPDKQLGEQRKPASHKRFGTPANSFGSFDRSANFQRICDSLTDISAIAKVVEGFRYRDEPSAVSAEIEPVDPLETTVANLWANVLGRRKIGINENFFEAGGTSLKAVQLIALIQRELKSSLSVTTLFECPTIKLLAARIRRAVDGGKNRSDALDALRRGQRRRYVRASRKVA